MKWLGRILGFLVLVSVLLLGIAFALPAQTEHTRAVELKQAPVAVFTAVSDVQKLPEWNRRLSKIDILPPIDGKETVRETFKDGMTMTVVNTESLSPTHFVREIRETNAPFRGSWTYEIAPTNDGCKVSVTEKSSISNPLFRLLMRLIGPTRFLDEHLVDLARHFGEEVKPR